MSATPQYTDRVISAAIAIATANSNRDGVTGSYGTAYTFTDASLGGKGGRVDAITIQATVTTTDGMIRMFINGDLVREITVAAITPSATVKAFAIPTTEGADANGRLAIGIVCAPGDIVKFCTEKAENFRVRVEGGEF